MWTDVLRGRGHDTFKGQKGEWGRAPEEAGDSCQAPEGRGMEFYLILKSKGNKAERERGSGDAQG